MGMARALGFILLAYLMLWYSLALRGMQVHSDFQDSLHRTGQVFLVTGIPAVIVVWIRARKVMGMLIFLIILSIVSAIVAELWYRV